MDKKIIKEWLNDIATPTGISYSGDRTISESMVEKIVDYIKSLQQENKQLKDELKSNPDTQITLQDDKGNKFMVIQTERIDMQVELNKTIEKLFNNWNKLKEYLRDFDIEYLNEIMKHNLANTLENILSKMQELEQGRGINEKNDSI